MEELNIPIFRALELNRDKYAHGTPVKAYDWLRNEDGDIEDMQRPDEKYFMIKALDNESSDEDMWTFDGFVEIDIKTLEITFDGENWYSAEEARRRINASYLAESIGVQQ